MVEEGSKLEATSVSGKTCTVSYGLNELLRLSIPHSENALIEYCRHNVSKMCYLLHSTNTVLLLVSFENN